MSYSVKFLPEAERDLEIAEDYLIQFGAKVIRDFTDTLKKKVSLLKDMPYSCPAYEDDPYFRRMVLGDYLLFYSVDKKRGLVVVHHIYHHKRNIDRLMEDYRASE